MTKLRLSFFFFFKEDLKLPQKSPKRIFKGTNGRQKTYEIFHVYCIFYSVFMCQTTVILE